MSNEHIKELVTALEATTFYLNSMANTYEKLGMPLGNLPPLIEQAETALANVKEAT